MSGSRRLGKKNSLYKRLASDVDITAITPNLMTIAYRSKDPQTAKNVVQSLLTIFAEKTAGSSRTEMDSAQRFLDDEIASYRDQLRAAEKRRAELARQYPDVVSDRPPDAPDTASDSRQPARSGARRGGQGQEPTRRRDDAARTRCAKRSPRSRRLLSVDRAPQVVVTGGLPSARMQSRLQQLRGNLDTLRLKYTDQHPDVIAAREEIRQLEGEIKHSGLGLGGRRRPARTQVPNTIYDQLKVKLVDAEGQVAAAQRTLAEAQAEQDRIAQIARSAPAVMTEAEDLDRDYGVLKKNYQELVSRREATLIADAADTKTEKIQFRIVDPPQVPLVPAEPNRPLLVSLVLLVGIGAGIAAPLVMTQLDRSFATISQLRDLGDPGVGQRDAAFARRGAAAGDDSAGRGVRQRGRADRRLRNIAGVELGPPFGGRIVMAESIGLIERAAALLRQREAAELGSPPPIRPASFSDAAPAAAEPVALDGAELILDRGQLASFGITVPSAERSRTAEEFRLVKRNLMAAWPAGNKSGNEHPSRIIMVTSSRPGEGKTFVSLNLAFAFASERDVKALLVDVDTHHSALNNILGLHDAKGLVDVLAGTADLSDALVRTNIENLLVLPSGRGGPHVPELLSSSRMSALLDELTRRFPDRFIILDTPPCMASSDRRHLGAAGWPDCLCGRGPPHPARRDRGRAQHAQLLPADQPAAEQERAGERTFRLLRLRLSLSHRRER